MLRLTCPVNNTCIESIKNKMNRAIWTDLKLFCNCKWSCLHGVIHTETPIILVCTVHYKFGAIRTPIKQNKRTSGKSVRVGMVLQKAMKQGMGIPSCDAYSLI